MISTVGGSAITGSDLASPLTSTSFSPPGLLAGAVEFEIIRDAIRQPGILRDLAVYVRRLADCELTQPVATREMEGFRLLHVSRSVLRCVINCGLAFQIHGDERHARRAIRDLQSAARFVNWNPSHFLDVAEMCCAFALGLDWLHEALSAAERLELEDALIRLGLEPGLADPKAVFITITNNWNAVCNGGLAMGAIAVRHRCPELADKLIQRCIDKLPLHGANYAPEGAFIEGPTYWAYGTIYHVLTVESLRRVTGATHGLDVLPGFRESAAYMAHITGPSGKFYSYFDSRDDRIALPALLWFGRHFGDILSTRAEVDMLRQLIVRPPETVLGTETRCFALSLLWLTPGHLTEQTHIPLAWSGDGPNPVAFWRTAWTHDAVWVGAKGGCATLSHGHMDAGSFVLEAGGVRWATDPGMEEYHRLEAMGVDLWHKERWSLFRLGPEGHSIPRIDGVFPSPQGACPRINWSAGIHPSVTFDLTALYPDAVSRLHRTIASGGPSGLVRWTDEVGGVAAGRIYRFTWVTTADVRTETGAVVLSQEGRHLKITTNCAQPVVVRVFDEAALLNRKDTPSPGIKRLEFAVAATGGDLRIEIQAALDMPHPATRD
jgi:oligo-alginate lyase